MISAPASSDAERDNVDIRYFDLDSDRNIELGAAKELLSPDELERAQRFHFDIHQDRFTRGRGALRRALSEPTGTDAKSIAFSYGAHGKPFIDGCPIHFNLSHSQDLCVLATSSDPIGVDVEFIERKTDVLELARAVFVASENEALFNAAPNLQRRMFFDFWTAKEAYMKLIGTGLSLPPKNIELKLVDDIPVSVGEPTVPKTKLTQLTTPDDRFICTLAQLV